MVQQNDKSLSSPPPAAAVTVNGSQSTANAIIQPATGNKRDSEVVMTAALNSALVQERFSFDGFHFVAVRDHILPSQCRHAEDDAEAAAVCQVCEYSSTLRLPQLPEMIFPNNALTITWISDPTKQISFNTLDALRMVNADRLPDVKVGPSAVWQQARTGVEYMHNTLKPFDWTFSSDYAGTVRGFQVEKTDERIDMEKLKRREPIHFYTQITLFEDEIADHGCAQMTVRMRVMPTTFFILQRFYLRVDSVLVRIIDTRIFGEQGVPYLLREWTRREQKIADIPLQEQENILDPNTIWHLLPVVDSHYCKLRRSHDR